MRTTPLNSRTPTPEPPTQARPPLLQRKCACGTYTKSGAECEQCGKKDDGMLQRKGFAPTEAPEAPPVVGEVLGSPGQPLDAGTRDLMEPRFGQDFSRVRVHTDERAAESARALNAQAYTVGQDLVFGAGQYAPNTQPGTWLLAHELAHVAQQSGTAANVQALSLERDDSHSERNANEAANAVVMGRAVPRMTGISDGIYIRRSAAGAIMGGLLGAGVGAGLGFLVGGPIGAMVGGLIGGLAGLITGETLSEKGRPFTAQEQSEAEIVFGNTIDWGKARLAVSAIMSIGGYTRTPFDTIYISADLLKWSFPKLMAHLVHELTHVWQTQHGISVATKLFWALHGEGAYKFGEEDGLRKATASGKRFLDFNTEQQGDICMYYYIKKKTNEDVSAYLPFIDQVQNHGKVADKSPDKKKSTETK